MADYVPSTTGGSLLIANKNGVGASAGINMDWTALEPRVGAAWKVFGSDKTVLRGGYSLYHDSAWSQGAQGLWQNPPFLGESDNFAGPTLSAGFALLPTPSTLANYQGAFTYEPTNIKLGRVQQYNVDVERQLFGSLLLTGAYAGAHGTHILMLGNDINTAGPSGCAAANTNHIGCVGAVPYTPNYGTGSTILEAGDLGTTSYNSLQIKAETKTPKHGLYALVAYTYSKTYDDGLSDGLGSELSAPYFPLPNWPSLDRALSQINLDNSFTGSVIYDLPFGRGRKFGANWNGVTNSLVGGWQATLIERASSGFPVPLIDSNNQSGVAFNTGGNSYDWNRPNQVANCSVYAANHGAHQWINPACFVAPAAGQLGNASRVPVVGPDFWNSDFSLIKQFALPRQDMGLNFRAEFFNLFNHPQYGMPINDINEAGFGAVNSTVNNPRLIQLALKLTF
jgi:hypothetical protein